MPAKCYLDSEPPWKPVIPIGLAQRFLNQGRSIKIAYKDVGGRATQEQLAGSSQIIPEFVQVQTVYSESMVFMPNLMNLLIKVISRHRLHAICGLGNNDDLL